MPRAKRPPQQAPLARKANGTFAEGNAGYQGRAGTDVARQRKHLNSITIEAMRAAFERGGTKAINTVMTKYPQTFLKMLVLLVPRELEVSHSGGVKALSDEQIEQTIQAIEAMMAKRAQLPGDGAKIIDAIPEEASPVPALPAPRRKRSKPDPAADPLA